MAIFGRNKKLHDKQKEETVKSKIEVTAHKRATRATVAKVKQATDTLNQVLDENGFTLKIYLAAGGSAAVTRNKDKP